jgi:hypothetical protein
MRSKLKKFKFQISQVHTGTYWYIPVRTGTDIIQAHKLHFDHLEPCQTRYRDTITRYRYIPILKPISGTILQIPDIGYFPISGIPILGHTRYRESRYRECPDIGNPDIGINIRIYRYRDQMSRYRVIEFPDIAHDVSCSQQAPGPGLGLAFRLLPPARNR